MKALNLFLVLLLTSCTQPALKASNLLLFKIEARNIAADKIIEYRYFQDGLVEETILQDSSNSSEIFQTSFNQAEPQIELLSKLQELDYHNSFPWKQDYHKRGDVIKVQFPQSITPQSINPNKETQAITINKTYFFYSGEQNAPEILQQLLDLTGLTRANEAQ
ncbi:MAG: hypothetical protein HOA17_10040 [Candidatus Melainabacteria bacterium]|jgi:hypothetical protein|nr:hypothetical protein [Candidatus Melainabacteria bacterium]